VLARATRPRLLPTALLCVPLALAIGGAALAQSELTPPAAATANDDDELTEIRVEGRGPRFVAPTTRDTIGRIWAPAYINGRGPFRLVLDTGASQSTVTAQLAKYLGYTPNTSEMMMMHGVTGSVAVPTIRVDSLTVGDLTLDGPVLPIVPDAMGGADGILGTAGLLDKRILIDFRRDKITITFSRDEWARAGFTTIPFKFLRGKLIVFDVLVGRIRTKAVIDTGGQSTLANLALRDALARRHFKTISRPNQVVGATNDVQEGEMIATPTIEFGPIKILANTFTYVDAYIFTHWQLTAEPAILLGMDTLGRLDTLIIDFRRRELQIRTH
jgi:predicted aspartyl protease